MLRFFGHLENSSVRPYLYAKAFQISNNFDCLLIICKFAGNPMEVMVGKRFPLAGRSRFPPHRKAETARIGAYLDRPVVKHSHSPDQITFKTSFIRTDTPIMVSWLNTFFQSMPAIWAVIIISLICAVGLAVGKIRIFGVSLGVTYVFFSASLSVRSA